MPYEIGKELIGKKVTWNSTEHGGGFKWPLVGEIVDIHYKVKEDIKHTIHLIKGDHLTPVTTAGGARKTRRHSKRAHRKSMRR
jgi:hypothetical protein